MTMYLDSGSTAESVQRVYVGHYHVSRIVEIDGASRVHRIRRKKAIQLDKRQIDDERPVLDLLSDVRLPAPRVADDALTTFWPSPDRLNLEYIPGDDLYPWTPAHRDLPPEVLRKFVDVWIEQVQIPSHLVNSALLLGGAVAIPATAKAFHDSMVDWMVDLHRRLAHLVDPLLRCAGLLVGDMQSSSKLLWRPFYEDSNHITERSLGLLHGDLSPKNTLFDGDRVSLIDWEMASFGDPLWDIAVFIERSQLTEHDEMLLLSLLEQSGLHFGDLYGDLLRYRQLERVKSILIDGYRFQLLVAESPERIEEATTGLSSRLTTLMSRWRRVEVDQKAVREYLLARAADWQSTRPNKNEMDDELFGIVNLHRRDTCGLDFTQEV